MPGQQVPLPAELVRPARGDQPPGRRQGKAGRVDDPGQHGPVGPGQELGQRLAAGGQDRTPTARARGECPGRAVHPGPPAGVRVTGPAGSGEPQQRRPGPAAASAAEAEMRAANGWVASTTARTGSAVRYATRPSTPPNPPTRTGPTGSAGSETRPASEESTSTPAPDQDGRQRAGLGGAAEQQHGHRRGPGQPGRASASSTAAARPIAEVTRASRTARAMSADLDGAAVAEGAAVLDLARVDVRAAEPHAEGAGEGGLDHAGVRARVPARVPDHRGPGGPRAAADQRRGQHRG